MDLEERKSLPMEAFDAGKEEGYKQGYEQRQGEVLDLLADAAEKEIKEAETEMRKSDIMHDFYRGYKEGAKNVFYSARWEIKNGRNITKTEPAENCKERESKLIDLIMHLKTQVRISDENEENPDSSSFNYHEGVLISANQAKLAIPIIERFRSVYNCKGCKCGENK